MQALIPLVRWFYPLFLVSVLVEALCYLLLLRRTYPWRETLASLAIFVLRLPARFAGALLTAPILHAAWTHRLATIPLNTAWGLALLLAGEEFAYYWMHRAGHEIRWAWASHRVHHTPEHLHLASAVRLGVTEILSGTWLFFLPLSLLGLNPLAVRTMLSINLFYQFWLHTDLIGRLGPLEWLFNTPSHHRVHHASNDVYLDRNYGGILIVWDRLFGTFAEERPGLAITYGLVHPIGSANPLSILFGEWVSMARDFRTARGWRGRLRQLFGRPGAGAGQIGAGEKAALGVSLP